MMLGNNRIVHSYQILGKKRGKGNGNCQLDLLEYQIVTNLTTGQSVVIKV